MTPPSYEIQYGADSAAAVAADLVVDYDVVRLCAATGVPTRCAELSDLAAEGAGPLRRLFMTVFPYTAKPQLARDFTAAARLLAADGTMTVRLTEPRLAPSIRRALTRHFADVRAVRKDSLQCAGRLEPGGAEPPERAHTISYFDAPAGRGLVFTTAASLFSFKEVDAGTRLLLSTITQEDAVGNVLDIGCGYGAIGCILAARGARVTLLDSDWRAVKLARANLAANHLAGEVLVGDASACLPAGPFDLAVSNPPTHAGSVRLRRIFQLAAVNAASVRIVVRVHLNYEKWLDPSYVTKRVAERDGYKVIAFAHR